MIIVNNQSCSCQDKEIQDIIYTHVVSVWFDKMFTLTDL